MARRSTQFTEIDVRRAAKGAVSAGLIVERIEIEGTKIVVVTAKTVTGQTGNSFDRLLNEA